jgi:hypothetical protein
MAISESVRKAILSNPGISESEKSYWKKETVISNRTLKEFDKSSGGGDKLFPIQDVTGRPLKAPVGSPEAEAQMKEASATYRKQQAQQQTIIAQKVDKFGRTPEYYNQTQKQMLINQAQAEIKEKTDKLATFQVNYYQNLVNKGRMNVDEANRQLNKVLGTYQEELIKSKESDLQPKFRKIDKESSESRQLYKYALEKLSGVGIGIGDLGKTIEPRKQYVERAERLRSFKFKESDFLVRGAKTDFPNIPYSDVSPFNSIIRTGFTTSEFVSAQLRIDKFFPKQPLVRSSTGEGIARDVVKFSFFSPVMQTTTQITRAIQPTRVIFKGVQQEIYRGKLKTKIGFITSSGEKGGAISISRLKSQIKGKTISDTIGVGGTYTHGVNLLGREIVKPKKQFISASRSISKQYSDIYKQTIQKGITIQQPVKVSEQITAGKIITKIGGKKETDIFIGFTKAITRGKESLVAGRTISKKGGEVISKGYLKKITPKGSGIIRIGLTGKPSVKTQSIGDLKDIISSAVQEMPKYSFSTPTSLGIVSATQATQVRSTPAVSQKSPSEKLITNTKIKQDIMPKLETKQVEIPTLQTRTKQKYTSTSRTKQTAMPKLETKQVETLIQQPKQKITQRQTPRYIQKLKQSPVQRGIFTIFTPTIPKTKKPIIPTWKLPKPIKQQKLYGKVPFYVRRFGKWKVGGYGKTKEQALLMGKQYSQKTLGRSFYVPGTKPFGLKGFKTKKEKGIGQIYIQKTGKGILSTLGSATEKAEIKFYRGLTPKKKKKLTMIKPIKKKKKRGILDYGF